MTLMLILSAGMLAIMWFAADRRPRRQVLFPSFTGSAMGGGKPNEYMGSMCRIGAIMGVVFACIGGLFALLVRVLP